MKDLLANILAALLAGAVGIGYVVAGLAVYAFTMFWWDVSFEAAIALPIVRATARDASQSWIR
jgi:hypothetical protein